MKSQKAAEESIKNPRGFIVLQTQMAFSLGSGNKQVILFLIKTKYFFPIQ